MRRKNRPVKHGPTRPKVRRQWGTERRAGAAPVMHPVPSRRAMSGARFALFLTIAAWVAYFGEQVRRYVDHPFGVRGTVEAVVYLLLVTLLTASAVGYLLARLGHLQRVRAHRREPRAVIDAAFDDSNPTLTAIVPSYKEDRRVIRQTLLSAALQEYPEPPRRAADRRPADADERSRRSSSSPRRARLPGEIERCSSCLAAASRTALDSLRDGVPRGTSRSPRTSSARGRPTTTPPAGSATWPRTRTSPTTSTPSSSNEIVAGSRRSTWRPLPRAARRVAANAEISAARMRQLYRRLVWIFRADAVELRAQALRLALARAEQGDEPQQLHRA